MQHCIESQKTETEFSTVNWQQQNKLTLDGAAAVTCIIIHSRTRLFAI